MDFWLTLAFSLSLLAAAAVMFATHVRTWRNPPDVPPELEAKETGFRWRQFRRRMQTTAMLALLGVAILVGLWITLDRVGPLVFSVYWGFVVLVVFWLILLALADVVSTKQHFGRIHDSQAAERTILEAELQEILANGPEAETSAPSEADGDRDEP